jgi:hypothetical protein
MIPSRRILIALVLSIAAAATVAALASAGSKPAVKPAWVFSHGLRAGSVVGTFCAPSNGATLCGDAAYPLHPRAHLPITPGGHMRLNLRRRAKSVEASLVRIDGDDSDFVGGKIDAERRDSRGRTWKLRLPDDLAGANALSISAKLESGDANWWAGVKPVERWP